MRPQRRRKENKHEIETSMGKVYLTNHAISRLRQRAQQASKSERKSFVKKVFSQGIHTPHKKLPNTEEFKKLRSYFYYTDHRVVKKNPYSKIIWYQDVVFIVSVEKVVITILTIPDEFKDMFSKAISKT